MEVNVSKQKRDDLLGKIKEIRTFIATAPQDENAANLLSYLSELEKDVNGKKYGLVFEEHTEGLVIETFGMVNKEMSIALLRDAHFLIFRLDCPSHNSLCLFHRSRDRLLHRLPRQQSRILPGFFRRS